VLRNSVSLGIFGEKPDTLSTDLVAVFFFLGHGRRGEQHQYRKEA
jgi:hypothetical protein